MASNLSQVEKSKKGLWSLEWLFNWTLSSSQQLRNAEKSLLSYLKTPYNGFYVDIGSVVGTNAQIWTISMNTSSDRTPLVVLHGLGSALALWLLNLDALARDRPVYAIDMLGFGRSSRPSFSSDPDSCERQLVEALEEWRSELKLRRIILLGHSMGAFIVSAYALSYPSRVQHMVLADAWGFAERPMQQTQVLPLWVRLIGRASLWCNPYWILRAVGPLGIWLVEATTPDIFPHFKLFLGSNLHQLTQYMHQCNAATPSGEAAFHTLSDHFAYAKRPMLNRIGELPSNIGITFIYGAQSWVSSTTGAKVKSMRNSAGAANVDVIVVNESGHHVNVEQAELFNEFVLAACRPF